MEKQPKYQVIYADPPWRYQRKRGAGVAENHYPTMSVKELCALPVQNLADHDCALFLWVTLPMLREVWSVIESWVSYGSSKTEKAVACFGAWDFGPVLTLNCVCLQCAGIPSATLPVCIRSL